MLRKSSDQGIYCWSLFRELVDKCIFYCYKVPFSKIQPHTKINRPALAATSAQLNVFTIKIFDYQFMHYFNKQEQIHSQALYVIGHTPFIYYNKSKQTLLLLLWSINLTSFKTPLIEHQQPLIQECLLFSAF